MSLLFCRMCLTNEANMEILEDTRLLELYEKLTNAKYDNDDRLPQTFCFICTSQLRKYRRFSNMGLNAQKILYNVLETGEEISQSSVLKHFGVKTLFSISFSPNDGYNDDLPAVVKEEILEIKVEPPEDTHQYMDRDSPDFPDVDVKAEEKPNTKIKKEKTKTKKSKKAKLKGELDPTKKFQCHFCDAEFKYEKTYDMHFRMHLMQKHKMCDNCTAHRNRSKKTRYFCEVCDKCFTAKRSVEIHMSTHTNEREFVCEKCGLSFSSKSNMVRHTAVAHTSADENAKPFACTLCDKTFKYKYFLNRHLKFHVSKKNRFACDLCDWKFAYKHNLQKHMRTHTGERPYSCKYCGKTFPVNGSLTVHLRIHTRTTPYQCAECNVSFTQKAHLTTHVKIIHRGEKPFRCELDTCDKTFTMRSNLKKHMKRHALKDMLSETRPLSV